MDDLNVRAITEERVTVILMFSEFMGMGKAIDSSIEIWGLNHSLICNSALRALFLTTCCQKIKFSARPGLRLVAYASESAT